MQVEIMPGVIPSSVPRRVAFFMLFSPFRGSGAVLFHRESQPGSHTSNKETTGRAARSTQTRQPAVELSDDFVFRFFFL